ncbi:MAG: metal-dependent hydrolase [Flavobacteriaceae bacterium]|nr:MAG: metal-dependent hydrolase [Flavobacteriaceae bacterium]
MDLEQLKYPIGQYTSPEIITNYDIVEWISILEQFPHKLEQLVTRLSYDQLETQYRPEGWTIRQVVHHIADSHHHSYTRFKWSLTEDKPLIKAYEEKEWAELFDAKSSPISLSLDYIKALHAKMVYLLRGLSKEQLELSYLHPEDGSVATVKENICKYAWHSSHHYAHIENLLKRESWL